MTRRNFLGSAAAFAAALPMSAAARKWPLGINTYCLRFLRWNDRQLVDWCVKQKLDAMKKAHEDMKKAMDEMHDAQKM